MPEKLLSRNSTFFHHNYTTEAVAEIDAAYSLAMEDGGVNDEVAHNAVYRFYPPLDQVQAWFSQAGLLILEEGHGDDVHHIIARRD